MRDELVKRLRDHIAVYLDDRGHVFEDEALCDDAADRIEELEEEVARLRTLVPRPDMTNDEILWRDFKRGVPLAELAKERGATRERIRYTLTKIERNMEQRALLTNDVK